MTNRYLIKIAKEYYNRVEESDPRLSSALGAAAVGGVAAHQLNSRVGGLLQKHVVAPMLDFEPSVPSSVMDKLRDETLKATNSTMSLAEAGGSRAAVEALHPVMSMNGPAFAPHQSLNFAQKNMHRALTFGNRVTKPIQRMLTGKATDMYEGQLGGKPTFNKNYVHMGPVKNTDILAHELGHAVDYSKGNVALKRGLSTASRILHGAPAAAIGGLALTNENTRDYAWTVPLLAAAPVLREEAAANINAAKLVKQYGGSAKGMRGLFGRNLLSYSIPAIAASGALAGINHLRRKGEEINPEDYIKDR
jgi:hypothetical protein